MIRDDKGWWHVRPGPCSWEILTKAPGPFALVFFLGLLGDWDRPAHILMSIEPWSDSWGGSCSWVRWPIVGKEQLKEHQECLSFGPNLRKSSGQSFGIPQTCLSTMPPTFVGPVRLCSNQHRKCHLIEDYPRISTHLHASPRWSLYLVASIGSKCERKALQSTETQIQKCYGTKIKFSYIKLGSTYATPPLPLTYAVTFDDHIHPTSYQIQWIPIQWVPKSWISSGFPVFPDFRAWQGTLLALALDQDICQLVLTRRMLQGDSDLPLPPCVWVRL